MRGPSEFAPVLEGKGVAVDGYKALRVQSSTMPTPKSPCYLGWTGGNPGVYLSR